MSTANPQPAYGRRWASSLFLLIFALLVAISAFAQVGLARDGRLPTGMFGYGVAIVALAVVAFLVVQRWAPYADPLLVPLAVLLNGVGLAMIYRIDQTHSADYAASKLAFEHSHPGRIFQPYGAGASATQQLLWTTLSIALFAGVVLLVKDIKQLSQYTYILGFAGLIFLVMPLFFPAINGSKVWITVGGFSIQPAEFSKFALVAFFAGYLVKKGPSMSAVGRKVGPLELPRARELMPIVVLWLISMGILAIQNDFGTALLFFGLFVCMLYIGTGKVSWVLIGILLFIGGALLLWLGAQVVGGPLAHITQRVDTWLDPDPYFNNGCNLNGKVFNSQSNPTGYASCLKAGGFVSDSSQLMQGMFALGQGGVLGTGLGQGQPFMTPLAFSDEIFTSLGEELGLTGLMSILVVYAILVQRGFKISVDLRDGFSKLFAGGISFVFALQVFVIVGGVTRLIPFTGLTTPFMAQGGSSLLANWMLIAILVRLSDQARKPAPQSIQDEGMTQIVSLR